MMKTYGALSDGSKSAWRLRRIPYGFLSPRWNGEGRVILTGQVRDVDGDPVVGAHIRLPGTGRGTVTDREGRYLLPLDGPGSYRLLVSAPGFRDAELPATPMASGRWSMLHLVLERRQQ